VTLLFISKIKIMKINILSIICLLSVCSLSAQQEAQYTQFMPYKMVFNSAYAGLDGAPSFALVARQQWLGFEGGPQSQLVNFHMPLGSAQRVGVGGTIRRFIIGPTEDYTTEAAYAYNFPFARGNLSMGINASLRLMRVNFNQLESIQDRSIDDAIPVGIQSKTLPNFGFGIYYDSDNIYLGMSLPRLLRNNIDFAEDAAIISREVSHLFVMGGFKFGNPEGIEWMPQILLKYVAGAPFDADASISAIYKGRHSLGVGYRVGGSKRSGIGESVSLFLSLGVNEKLSFGLGYDYTLSALQRFNSGTIEGFVKYIIGGKEDSGVIISPRGETPEQ